MTNDVLKLLPGALLPWYRNNRRDLPWRQDKEPYHVWLSEIMLQQTRVEAVKGYYARFLETLPTIGALASCDDEILHKLWEGLGYYSRVRNLKKAAIQIMELHVGAFPREYEQIRALPGIGDYTAGAICSICFDMPRAAVDGNVLRVISRLTEDATPIDLNAHKKAVTAALEAVYPVEAGEFTQALMELGAESPARLRPLSLPGFLRRCNPQNRAAISGETAEKGKTGGGEDRVHSLLRWPLRIAETAGFRAVGRFVAVSQCFRQTGTGGGTGCSARHGTAPP